MSKLSEETRELTRQLKALNQNIEILTKVTAVNIGKEDIFKGKETKEEKVKILDRMGLSNEIIAIITGSTSHSVSQIKSVRKPKTPKPKGEPQNMKPTNEGAETE